MSWFAVTDRGAYVYTYRKSLRAARGARRDLEKRRGWGNLDIWEVNYEPIVGYQLRLNWDTERPSGTRVAENPAPISDSELLIGGVAAIALLGAGITLVYKAVNQNPDTSTTLGDTASVAALATLVPL